MTTHWCWPELHAGEEVPAQFLVLTTEPGEPGDPRVVFVEGLGAGDGAATCEEHLVQTVGILERRNQRCEAFLVRVLAEARS